MKHHEIIWTDDGTRLPGNSERNVIVLTIEELRELAVAMVKSWVDETCDGSVIEDETVNDLNTYLTSKGITIP